MLATTRKHICHRSIRLKVATEGSYRRHFVKDFLNKPILDCRFYACCCVKENLSVVQHNIYTICKNRVPVHVSFTHLTVVQKLSKYMQIKCIAKYIVTRILLQNKGNEQIFSCSKTQRLTSI